MIRRMKKPKTILLSVALLAVVGGLAVTRARHPSVEVQVADTPFTNLILGLRSRSLGGVAIQIGSGVARDTTDAEFLVIPRGESRNVDISTNGPGGLDQGSPSPRTSYALWIVLAGGVAQCVASRSFNGEGAAFPSGAKMRRIGSFATDDTGMIIRFRQIGMSNDREVHYKTDTAALTILKKGTSTTFKFVPFGYLAPMTLETVFVAVAPSSAAVTLRTDSSSEQTFGAPGVGTYLDGLGQGIEYRNEHSGSKTNLYVTGYSETL